MAKRTTKGTGKGRFDLYQAVTDRILEMLEQGTVPWKSPIKGAAGWPKNLASGKKYRGVNVFLLAMTALSKDYRSPWWVTFNQAKERGGSVKKGEKSTMVVFWKKLIGDDEEVERDVDGKPTKPPFVLRYYRVFNAQAQCEGLDVPVSPDEQDLDFSPIDEAEKIIKGYPNPPKIVYEGYQAYYRPSTDTVHLPMPERFVSDEEAYSTTFHELVHSSGAQKRLDRLEEAPQPFGSPAYGKEELVAEFGSAMLCGMAGIDPSTIEQSAAYIAGWKKTIKADNKLVVQAAAQAQRAADHILGITWDEAANENAPLRPVEPSTPGRVDTPTPTHPEVSKALPSPPPIPPTLRAAVRLAWDFRIRFPLPTDEAIEQDRVEPKHTTPAGVVDLHSEYEREITVALDDVDAAKGLEERQTLERILASYVDTYAELFGDEAARAFKIAVDCRRRGEPVALSARPGPGLVVDPHRLEPINPAGAPPPPPLTTPAPQTKPLTSAERREQARWSHAPDEVTASNDEWQRLERQRDVHQPSLFG